MPLRGKLWLSGEEAEAEAEEAPLQEVLSQAWEMAREGLGTCLFRGVVGHVLMQLAAASSPSGSASDG